jgi:hypothetical protein
MANAVVKLEMKVSRFAQAQDWLLKRYFWGKCCRACAQKPAHLVRKPFANGNAVNLIWNYLILKNDNIMFEGTQFLNLRILAQLDKRDFQPVFNWNILRMMLIKRIHQTACCIAWYLDLKMVSLATRHSIVLEFTDHDLMTAQRLFSSNLVGMLACRNKAPTSCDPF